MKYYAQFLENSSGQTWCPIKKGLVSAPITIVDAMGSDGVFILDGRNSLSTMINDATKRMKSLSKVKPNYIGFKIMRGEKFTKSKEIYHSLK